MPAHEKNLGQHAGQPPSVPSPAAAGVQGASTAGGFLGSATQQVPIPVEVGGVDGVTYYLRLCRAYMPL